MKKNIIILSMLLTINCQKLKTPVSSQPDSDLKIRNLLHSADIGILKEASGQLYWLVSKDASSLNGNTGQIPDSVTTLAKDYLSRYFGREYVGKYFTCDSLYILDENWYTFDIGGRFGLTFWYHISINDYHTNLIVATYHDSSGNVIIAEGVVDRLADSKLGMPFHIDDETAVKIAKSNDFSAGYFPWKVTFQFNSEIKRYTWYIRNQTKEAGGCGIEIDAQTGIIHSRHSWVCMA